MRTGILGGTFDPIHYGHLRMAVEAREALRLDRVVLMVANISPFKQDRQITDAAVRLRLAVEAADQSWMQVDDREVLRGGVSYTVDSIDTYRGDSIWLLLGSDAAAGFLSWKQPKKILEQSRLAVFSRAPDEPNFLPEEITDYVDMVQAPRLEISSTMIRDRVASGRSIRYLTPDSVIRLIEEFRLYI